MVLRHSIKNHSIIDHIERKIKPVLLFLATGTRFMAFLVTGLETQPPSQGLSFSHPMRHAGNELEGGGGGHDGAQCVLILVTTRKL